jgi:uncharacterized repeat protein (TIGR01451 family)
MATVTSGGCGNDGSKWYVDVWLEPLAGATPKLELNAGVQDPYKGDWKYWKFKEGESTISKIDGTVIAALTHMPANLTHAFQMGISANGKNLNFGASGWFFWKKYAGNSVTEGYGDFNLDLEEICNDTDVSIKKSCPEGDIYIGSEFEYTLIVTNEGKADATNVSVTDVLPSNVTFVSADNGGVENPAGTVKWTITSLPKNTSKTLKVKVKATKLGTNILNVASVSIEKPKDTNGENNRSTCEVTIKCPEIKITIDQVNVKCNGLSSGSITVQVSGGNAPYEYTLDNGTPQQSNKFENLKAGSYVIKVTDKYGCENKTNVTITEPTKLEVTIQPTNGACVNGQATLGSATASAQGGKSPYSYKWSNGAETASINNLANGEYTVTVTDANGCTATEKVTIANVKCVIEPLNLTSECAFNEQTRRWRVTNPNPFPVAITWEVYGTAQNGGFIAPSGLSYFFTNNVGGANTTKIYWFDGNGVKQSRTKASGNELCDPCKKKEKESLIATYTPSNAVSDPSVHAHSHNHSIWLPDFFCNGQTAIMTFDAGSQVHHFPLSHPHRPNWIHILGMATVTSGGCGNDGSKWYIDVWLEPLAGATPKLELNAGVQDPYKGDWKYWKFKEGESTISKIDGTVIAALTHMPANLTHAFQMGISANGKNLNFGASGWFFWKKYAGNSVTEGYGDFNLDLEEICNDTDVSIKKSCPEGDIYIGSEFEYTLIVTNEGKADATNVSVTDVLPSNVTFVSADNGGVENPAGTVKWTITSLPKNTSKTLKVKVKATKLGTNILNVASVSIEKPKDTNGENNRSTCEVTIKCPEIKITIDQVNVKCNGLSSGSITVQVSGGNAPYEYTLDNGTPQQSNKFENLKAGSYVIKVTDKYGCENKTNVTITEPTKLEIEVIFTPIKCHGGKSTVTVKATGGTPDYKGTGEFEVMAGEHTYEVIDANGCKVSKTIKIGEPTELQAGTVVVNVACSGGNNGSIDLTVTGGTKPYSFKWDNGAETEDISGLSAGTYNVTITDDNGCEIKKSATISQAGTLTIKLDITPIACNGGKAIVVVTAEGGTPDYKGTGTFEVGVGEHTFTVKDKNGCEVSEKIVIKQPRVLRANGEVTNVTCHNQKDGSIDLTVTGGTSPYIFEWSNGAATEDISGLKAGDYTVIVTDANKCTVTKEFKVREPRPLKLDIEKIDVTCNGESNGSIDLTVSGGTKEYSFKWSNGAATEDVSGLEAGVYSVIVTDANGCEAEKEVRIREPRALKATTIIANVSCEGKEDGNIDLTVTGGTQPYSFKWSNGAETEDLTGVPAGIYEVVITDANKCEIKTSAEIKTDETDIAITKSCAPSKVTVGDEITYTIEVENKGKIDATGVTVKDVLPAGVTLTSNPNNGTVNGNEITWEIATLKAGEILTLTLKVQANTIGMKTNVASVTITCPIEKGDAPNRATCGSEVEGESADISVVKECIERIQLGGIITYTIKVKNHNKKDGATVENIKVSDQLPEGVSFVSATGGAIPNGGGLIEWTIPSLAPQQTKTFKVTVLGNKIGNFENVASIKVDKNTTIDSNENNNESKCSTEVFYNAPDPCAIFHIRHEANKTSTLYTVDLTDGSLTAVRTLPYQNTHFALKDGYVYFVSGSTGKYGTLKLADGSITEIGTMKVGQNVVKGITQAGFDVNGNLFIAGGKKIYNVPNINVAVAVKKCDISIDESGDVDDENANIRTDGGDLALASDGTWYIAGRAKGNTDDRIYRLDPATCDLTEIAKISGNAQITGMAILDNGEGDLIVSVHSVGFVIVGTNGTVKQTLANKTLRWGDMAGCTDKPTPVIRDLKIVAECLPNDKFYKWTVSNPNTSAIATTWETSNGQSGNFNVPANASYTFFTTNTGASVTATIKWLDGKMVEKSANTNSIDEEACAPCVEKVNKELKAVYSLSNAVADPTVALYSGGHSFHFTNLFCNDNTLTKMTFDANSYMYHYADNTLHIVGIATVYTGFCANASENGKKWFVDIWLDPLNSANPKLELKDGAQPVAITNTWKYWKFRENGATITKLDGTQTLKLSHMPEDLTYAFQMGETANGKNLNFGASGWFFWERVQDGRKGHGDINVDVAELCVKTDITITKACVESVELGEQITYKLTVTNQSKYHASKVVVTDKLPTGVSFVSANNAGTHSMGVVTWNLGVLAPNEVVNLEVVVNTKSTGLQVNEASVKTETPEESTSNNLARCSTNIKQTCPTPADICETQEAFAGSVVDYKVGKRGDMHSSVIAARTVANNALGAPQNDDNLSSPTNFVSLGFGDGREKGEFATSGYIDLELATPVYNWNKNGVAVVPTYAKYQGEISYGDLIVVETSWGRAGTSCGYPDIMKDRYPEQAAFYGRECPEKPWVYLGQGCRTSFVDVANVEKAGQKYVKYLKIVEVSDVKQFFTNVDDGYDVDGVIACPNTVQSIISTGSYSGRKISQGRKEGGFSFSLDYFNNQPNVPLELIEVGITAYPNPSNGRVVVDMTSVMDSDMVEIQIFNTVGALVETKQVNLNVGTNRTEIDLTQFANGMYILKTSSKSGASYSNIKIVKE